MIVKDTANSDELNVNFVKTEDAEVVFNKLKKIEDQAKQPDSNKTEENIVMLSVKKADKNFNKLYNNYMNYFIKFRTFYEQAIRLLKKRLGFRANFYVVLYNSKYLQTRYSTSE